MTRLRPPPELPLPDERTLAQDFDARTRQRGRSLQRDGAVDALRYDQEIGTVRARVQGTASRPYEVELDLGDGELLYDALCTCPVEVFCKHAWATCLELLERRAERAHSPGGTPYRGGRRPDTAPADDDAAARRVDEWLARFADAVEPDATRVAREPDAHGRSRTHEPTRMRIYALDAVPVPGFSNVPAGGPVAAGVGLRTLEAGKSKAGRYNKGRRHRPAYWYLATDVRVTPLDREIAALGAAHVAQVHGRWHDDEGFYTLSGRGGALMLDLAIESGRCFLGEARQDPVRVGPARALQLEWHEGSGGARRLKASLEGLDAWWAVPTDPPRWLDPATAACGPIETSLSGEQLQLALCAPPVPEASLTGFADALQEIETRRHAVRGNDGVRGDDAVRGDDGGAPSATLLPAPAVASTPTVTEAPRPVLLLYSPDGEPHVDTWRLTLFAVYGETMLPCAPFDERTVVRAALRDGTEARVLRRPNLERDWLLAMARRFPEVRLRPGTLGGDEPSCDFEALGETPAERFRRYRRVVGQREALEAEGWTLAVIPPVHVDPVRPPRFHGRIVPDDEADGPGWFSVELGYEHADARHSLMPLVVEWLERGGGDEPVLAEMPDGRFVEVPAAALAPVAEVFEELGSGAGADGRIRLSRARALALDAVERGLDDGGFETAWEGGRELRDFSKRLRRLGDIDTSGFEATPAPRALKAELRPYQRAGLGWLDALAEHELCGILADDMGLGKTLQTLAHVLSQRRRGRLDAATLVVAPTSVLGNWAREAAKFAPKLRVRVWHGAERHEDALAAGAPDLVITSYALALRDRDLLAGHGFGLLVLDEAQHIKNAAAKTARALKSLPIERRLCLTGTPLENHLGELWSQFDFLMPGLLGDAARFTRHYRTPIEKRGDATRQRRLSDAIRPFVLRRRKEEVATELPPRTDIVRDVRLGAAQAKLYESIRVAMQARVREALEAKGVEQSRITVLDSLLKLRQLCCHPRLLKLPSARKVAESAKTDVALDMIEELVGEGRRILLFSSFTSLLTLLESELRARGVDWVKLTGRTRRRDEAIDAFQRGDVPLFLISLKAGGTGLNLTAADTVIHYDPWWNPAAEEQAAARAHRIGQDKPVFVYRLVTADTVEERIVAMQERKRRLADATLERGEAGPLATLSVEETLSLFD